MVADFCNRHSSSASTAQRTVRQFKNLHDRRASVFTEYSHCRIRRIGRVHSMSQTVGDHEEVVPLPLRHGPGITGYFFSGYRPANHAVLEPLTRNMLRGFIPKAHHDHCTDAWRGINVEEIGEPFDCPEAVSSRSRGGKAIFKAL